MIEKHNCFVHYVTNHTRYDRDFLADPTSIKLHSDASVRPAAFAVAASARLHLLRGDPVGKAALDEEQVDLRLDGGVGPVPRELDKSARSCWQ